MPKARVKKFSCWLALDPLDMVFRRVREKITNVKTEMDVQKKI